MEVKFWKHTSELWVGWFLLLTISFCTSIIGLILTIIKDTVFLFMVFMGLFIILLLIFDVLFIEKHWIAKVIFSESGIEVTRLKKQIDYISWDDIIRVEETTRAYNLNWLCFVAKDKKINVSLTKKMYDTIMLICPYNNIKVAIRSLNSFKGFNTTNN